MRLYNPFSLIISVNRRLSHRRINEERRIWWNLSRNESNLRPADGVGAIGSGNGGSEGLDGEEVSILASFLSLFDEIIRVWLSRF